MRKDVIGWLLEDDQPSIKYLTLTELLGKKDREPEVKHTLELIPRRGWAQGILAKQSAQGWWVSGSSLSRPKYLATYWMLLILSDLRVPRDSRIIRACDLLLKRFSKNDGGFGYDKMRTSEMCITASAALLLFRFGYGDDPRVKSAIRWLVDDQKENGGWRCGWRRGIIDGWEPMAFFAAYPKKKWTRSIKRAAERGAEFYLERELHKEGKPYQPWYRFHYPVHYYYDVLVGLDFLTRLGYGQDRRLSFALNLLKEKRRPDGKWSLEGIHPDLEGKIAELYSRKPPIPFSIEPVGRPSKMVTLRAVRVLQRTD